MFLLKNKLRSLLLLTFAQPCLAAGFVGNGGDVAFCRPSIENKFTGLYTTDFLIEAKNHSETEFPPVISWEQLASQVSIELASYDAELKQNFDEFISSLYNNTARRRWQPAVKLARLFPTDAAEDLPPNCLGPAANPTYQGVIRIESLGTYPREVVYLYDAQILKALGRYPLQLSFLLVHEWLWNFTQDKTGIRRLNWLLHTGRFQEFLQLLKKIQS